jgi:hypothetical protein
MSHVRLTAIAFALSVLAAPVLAQPAPQQPPQRPQAQVSPAPGPAAPAVAPPAATQLAPDRPAISLAVDGKSVKVVPPYGSVGSSDFKDHPVVSGYYPRRCRPRHLARVRSRTARH